MPKLPWKFVAASNTLQPPEQWSFCPTHLCLRAKVGDKSGGASPPSGPDASQNSWWWEGRKVMDVGQVEEEQEVGEVNTLSEQDVEINNYFLE